MQCASGADQHVVVHVWQCVVHCDWYENSVYVYINNVAMSNRPHDINFNFARLQSDAPYARTKGAELARFLAHYYPMQHDPYIMALTEALANPPTSMSHPLWQRGIQPMINWTMLMQQDSHFDEQMRKYDYYDTVRTALTRLKQYYHNKNMTSQWGDYTAKDQARALELPNYEMARFGQYYFKLPAPWYAVSHDVWTDDVFQDSNDYLSEYSLLADRAKKAHRDYQYGQMGREDSYKFAQEFSDLVAFGLAKRWLPQNHRPFDYVQWAREDTAANMPDALKHRPIKRSRFDDRTEEEIRKEDREWWEERARMSRGVYPLDDEHLLQNDESTLEDSSDDDDSSESDHEPAGPSDEVIPLNDPAHPSNRPS
jgi:hypothetical protein